MPPVLLKDVWVEIRHSLGRFCSILLIVALGVSFFAGIKASAPDMKNSADVYFDKYRVQDIQIYSTLGLDKDDLEEVQTLPGVAAAQGSFSIDALTKKGSTEQVVKVIAYTDGQKLNQPRLVEGRMPKHANECLIEADSVTNELYGGYAIGDKIRLYSGTKEKLDTVLHDTTFTITGKAYNPNWLSYEKGTSAIGSGEVNTFIYVPDLAVKADYYTEIDVAVQGARDVNTYGNAYFPLIDPVVDELENLADGSVARHIADAQAKVDEAKAEAEEKLDEAKKELDKGKKELANAKKDLKSGESEIQSNEEKLEDSKAQLAQGWNQYNANKEQVDAGLEQVNAGIAKIEESQKQLPDLEEKESQLQEALEGLDQIEQGMAGISQLAQAVSALPDEAPEKAQLQAQLAEAVKAATGDASLSADAAIQVLQQKQAAILASVGSREQAQEALAQVQAGIGQIEEARKQLPDLQAKKSQLEAGLAQLASSYDTLVSSQAEIASGEAQLAEAKEKISEGTKEYDSGKKEYDEHLSAYKDEKKKAEEKIADAQKQVDELDGKWIVLDRDSHYSWRDYQDCAQRMDGIASVFPVFFYLVAALVCMTTMTRMVQEQRNEIGTLKALGYSKVQIALKYLLYAGLACVCGCIVGCAVGMLVFPYIIYSAWNTMYNLESIQFVFQPGLIMLASGTVLAVVLAATIFSIYRELMEVPSQLMRPKAGKAGKKILLERVPVVWNKIPFMDKVTLRNLFRYKKRFFMTVIGIAGCSALLVSGFGLNDSISDIVAAQFERIYHYDATVTAKKDVDFSEVDNVKDVYKQQLLSVTIEFDKKDVAANLNILSDPDSFQQFMTFIPMMGSEGNMKLDDSGVFISIKTAEKMGLKLGDDIAFETAGGQKISAKVTGIFDQYIDHQIYVTQSLFDSWHVKEKPNISYLVIENSTANADEDAAGAAIMNLDGVKSVTFYSSLQENFLNMISAIKMVVVVLVLSAAMLAFVVLYNLANVSISERMREIATIKVLGFTEKEINSYVNRESLVMALVGGIAGLFVGIYLHDLIMALAELDSIRFGRTINPSSFVISLGLTLLFALAVNWVMKFKLRKIHMVESLKAVE